MKKRYVLIPIALLLLLLFIWVSWAGLWTVSFIGTPNATIVYDYTVYEKGADGEPIPRRITFEEELTEAETNAVVKILEGKNYDFYFGSTPSCGFDQNIAIIVNGVRFAIACDSCGTLLSYRNLQYVEISNEERAVLEELFTSRGGKFPCI